MNKNMKHILLTVVAAMLLVVVSVGGTLAYLQDKTQTVVNTFSVGKVGIILNETDVDVYGVKDGDTRVLTNDYKLMPGHTYTKDPMVTVEANSEESYIRILVTVADYADLCAVFPDNVVGDEELGNIFLLQDFVDGWDANTWRYVSFNSATKTYEFRYVGTVNTLDGEELELAPLFTSFTIPGEVQNEALATLDDLQIDVVAHAIQVDGFKDSEDGTKTAEDVAWEAFDSAKAATAQ